MQETIKTKICNGCQIEKSVEEFSKHKTTKDGLQARCKECAKTYHQENTERAKTYKQTNAKKIAKQDKAYKVANRNKLSEYRKEYYSANKEVILEHKKEYRQSNREAITEQGKAYYQANASKIAERHKDYYQTPIGKAMAKNSYHKRRSITRQGDVTTQQLLELEQNAKTCYWCNTSLKGKKVHIDHYVPLSKGGEHTLSNLVVSCQKCNLTKGVKDPIVFAQSVGKLF